MGEMEIENEELKRKVTGLDVHQHKKLKKFSAKAFRSQLLTTQKLPALQTFLQQIQEYSDQDCALEYLQHHGNIHEILQCMEQDSALPPVLILEIVNKLLLKIASCKLDCQETAYESCRYLLKNFVAAINKMLGLTSSSKERIVILKLLTTMTTFSSHLSKEILIHVNFNLTNLELITKNTLENKTVRKHFVFFLTAILIDIEYPTLSLLLDKKGMLTSIIPGLQYDDVDTVCFILTAMKNNILENQFVSKSVKMKTFNTIVVKHIVNLYNWKGPSNLKTFKKEGGVSIPVDEIQKAKVSESVHDFLLILCTSHKYGVIFRDPLVGLGKKTQNALIYTVLESMDSPWEHSYASELVLKICSACPDLTKFVWNNLKGSLEPRHSVKWLTLVDFVKKLIEELQPSCLDPYVKHLNLHQFSQLVTILIAPLPVLKILVPENYTYDSQIVRYNVILLISTMLKSLQGFITAYEKWSNKEQLTKLICHLTYYIERNFPTGQVLLQNWEAQDEVGESTGFNSLKYLSAVFDIFEYYIKLCPQLLETLKCSHSDLKILLETMNSFSIDTINKKDVLQVKVIDLFLNVNPSVFSLHSDSFNYFLSFLLKTTYDSKGNDELKSISVLKNFLKNTTVFDYGRDRELSIWVNGIFSLKSLNEDFSTFLGEALKLTQSKMIALMTKMSNFYQNIEGGDETENDSCVSKSFNLSPMLLGVLEYLKITHLEKYIANYLYFVIPNLTFLQADNALIYKILEDSHAFDGPLLEYINLILGDEHLYKVSKALKIPKILNIFDNFNSSLADDNFDFFLTENKENFTMYPDMKFDLLQMGIFYLSKLLKLGHLKQTIYSNNLIKYIEFVLLNGTYFAADLVLEYPPFINYFSILDLDENGDYNCCSLFILGFIKIYSQKYKLLEKDLHIFNKKIVKMIFRIIKNPKKYADLQVIEVINKFEMNRGEYFNILSKICDHVSDKVEKCKYKSFYEILLYYLEEYCKSAGSETLLFSDKMCENLFSYYILLNETAEINTTKLSNAFLSFLSFPNYIHFINARIVTSILNMKDYNKAHADLLVFILNRRRDLILCITENLDDLIAVKGTLYPVLQILSESFTQISDEDRITVQNIFRKIFIKFKDTLHKILRKPQKASQHIENNYQGVIFLINSNFQSEIFQEYVSRVHKFEVTRIFHANLLYSIFKKFIGAETDSKIITNMILTFVHLLLNILKRIQRIDENTSKNIDNVTDCVIYLLDDVQGCSKNFDLKMLQNDSFKLLIKLSLKYGVSENARLLQMIKNFITLIGPNFEEEHSKVIMDMLISHSEFLNVVLSENHKCKLGVISLMLVMCTSRPQMMDRSHVPILLSAYQATLTESDKMTLKLLKMYEGSRNQTLFTDFKPYLWGNSAANYYSVRSDIEKALLKQPRMADVLNLLHENIVISTIKNYHLYHSKDNSENLKQNAIYDLEFFLPLFSHLLAPENVVQTYHFTKSGALSLSIIGLSSNDPKMRASACHVLSRFYFHVEARQTGKDNLLWIRLVEAICRGIAVTDEIVFNNFASIFLARTALILTQPNHTMYIPLSQYLAAKPVLNFSSIPELYTFLHSSDVNYKDHRNFIFEILSDGLICENDYKIFFRSMALKLFTEFYSSCTCDVEAKFLILDVLISLCRLPLGVTFVCSHNALIEYLVMDLEDNLAGKSSTKYNISVICKLVQIFHKISLKLDDSFVWGTFLLSNVSQKIMNSDLVHSLPNSITVLLTYLCKK